MAVTETSTSLLTTIINIAKRNYLVHDRLPKVNSLEQQQNQVDLVTWLASKNTEIYQTKSLIKKHKKEKDAKQTI